MQTNNLLKWLTGAMVLLVLTSVNIAIYLKQQTLKHGTVVILELAPVDPRSLLQGDYMALNYALARPLQDHITQQRRACRSDVHCTPPASHGKIVVELNAQHQAINAAFDRQQPLQAQEVVMQYRLSGNTVSIGTPSYFFQEGQAARFAKARYGEFRVDRHGNALLTHLLDAQGKRIIP